MQTSSLERIIQYVDMVSKPLEIVYRANGAAVEGLANRNGNRWKLVGEGKDFSWGDAQNNGTGHKCKLTKNMFLHSDMLKLCRKKNTTSVSSSLTQLFFTSRKIALRTNEIKR